MKRHKVSRATIAMVSALFAVMVVGGCGGEGTSGGAPVDVDPPVGEPTVTPAFLGPQPPLPLNRIPSPGPAATSERPLPSFAEVPPAPAGSSYPGLVYVNSDWAGEDRPDFDCLRDHFVRYDDDGNVIQSVSGWACCCVGGPYDLEPCPEEYCEE